MTPRSPGTPARGASCPGRRSGRRRSCGTARQAPFRGRPRRRCRRLSRGSTWIPVDAVEEALMGVDESPLLGRVRADETGVGLLDLDELAARPRRGPRSRAGSPWRRPPRAHLVIEPLHPTQAAAQRVRPRQGLLHQAGRVARPRTARPSTVRGRIQAGVAASRGPSGPAMTPAEPGDRRGEPGRAQAPVGQRLEAGLGLRIEDELRRPCRHRRRPSRRRRAAAAGRPGASRTSTRSAPRHGA